MLNITLVITTLSIYFNTQASVGTQLSSANTNISDTSSLQRGVGLFMNYCAGCHSIEFMRYNRIGSDLFLNDTINAYEQTKTKVLNNKPLNSGDLSILSSAFDNNIVSLKQVKQLIASLSAHDIEKNLSKSVDKMVKNNLMFNTEKIGENITSSMPDAAAKKWFGAIPPDLSLIARARGTDWVYTYLHSFYEDKSGLYGTNNSVLQNASMPDILWQLKQNKSPTEFDQDVRDITNFLDYVGEPIKLIRTDIGFKVLGFLLVLLVPAYYLKKEYWKDVKYGKWRTKKD